MYTYGTLGKPGSLPKTQLENEFITTHKFKYKPDNKIFPALFPMYEFSNLRGLNSRVAVSAGLGWNVVSKRELKLEADFGAGYESNDFNINNDVETVRLLGRLKWFYKIQETPLALSLIAVYQPSLENWNDQRLRGLLKANFKRANILV
jgi:hypothetical protein